LRIGSRMDRLASTTAFVRVVENGGFTAAARRLNLSATMVSNHVQELKDRLGTRLLNRTTRRVSLTERAYYERSLHILAHLDEADHMAGVLQSDFAGAASRSMLSGPCAVHRADLTAYLRDYPEVSVDLRRGDQIIDLLEEGFDLAIRPYVPPDSSLMVRRLPIARQPRERHAAFKDDARGSACPPYRTASTTRSVAATTCCASSRVGGGSSVRAASHQRAAAWPSDPRKVTISGLATPAFPIEAEERLLSLEHPAGTFSPCDHPSSQGAP
jgi:DNA-binding transcriptional LysR family regulator